MNDFIIAADEAFEQELYYKILSMIEEYPWQDNEMNGKQIYDKLENELGEQRMRAYYDSIYSYNDQPFDAYIINRANEMIEDIS